MAQDIERIVGLLERMYGSGVLSQESTDALLETGKAARDIGRGLGESSSASELLLATLLVDDSPSIRPYIVEVQRGHSTMLEALVTEQASADVLVHTRALNYSVLSPYQAIGHATRLTETNFSSYTLRQGTPLYLQSLLTLGMVVTKAQEEEDRGAKVRTFTLIISDGEDNRSGSIAARHVGAIVTDMLEFSTNHIVAGMGVGGRIDFRKVFQSMGIPERWIFDAGANADTLREVFKQIAASLHLAATSEDGFRQLAAGLPSDHVPPASR